ncbi:MAG: secondary thiamine-phosphate synthase enzyme YjbQ [Candidatus Aenigmarchaeota archaeon]|nr:secondary thiamine-phosphate synthase enzyme YjbQ [Candidatus Aenigmarchaeota archaeon]
MKVYQEEFDVRTSKRTQATDITEKVEKIVKNSKVKNGICLVFLPHATAAIILEESESGLMSDIEEMIKRRFPKGAGYEHDRIDDNADAHLASGFIGQSRIYPVKDYELVRGTWQRALLIELDGPRYRRVFVNVLGE